MANDQKVYLPEQTVRRGKAGWRLGPNMVVVDKQGKVVVEGPKKKSK